ncbi:MAG TPA: M20/M25/M40 family metallo-hydrolase [Ktedonobacterales bacterium]|nr:M20/M25/M40 family metallo-hydrolase [Ktedonobacterales bacterium]
MEQPPAELEGFQADLAALTSLHGVSGYETNVIRWLRDRFAPYVDAVTIDPLGNLIATRAGPAEAPHLVVSAHADEIGLVVASVEPDGFLRLEDFTGVQPRLLEGRFVRVGAAPGVSGVIGARSAHGLNRDEWGRGARLEELYLDLGVETAADVAALGVRVGDPVVVVSELQRLAATRVAGKGLDNRAGCVVLLHLLRRLHGRPLPCRLTALVTVQEEAGLRGAHVAYVRLHPDLALVVDTRPAGGTPDTRSQTSLPRVGQGVIVSCATSGYLVSRTVQDAMRAVAERQGIPYQWSVASGGSSDAAAAHLAASGVATMDLGVPRRYAHSAVELLDLRDLAAAITFAEAVVLQPPSAADLAFLGPPDGE